MLKQKIQDNIKQAMKNKDVFTRDALRFLYSSIKQIEIDTRIDVKDIDVIKVIQKFIKQRNDTIIQYKEASRDDLIEKEELEIKLLKQYLPEQISDKDLKIVIEETIKEVQALSKKDMGKVMKKVSEKLEGKADGKRINQVVASILK